MKELIIRAVDEKESTLILYCIALGGLALAQIILIPVVVSVNKQKDKVLSLFCEIDNQCIKVLSLRCERFLNNLTSEEGNDEIDSNEDLENNLISDDDEEYSLISGGIKKIKKAKGKTKADVKFFIKFAIALQTINAYYMANYIVSRNIITTTDILRHELNQTAITIGLYWFH